jgi:hypothetical protein
MKTKTVAKTKKPTAKKKLANQCKFAFSDSRFCAMPRWNRHRSYCLFHARQEQQILDADRVGEELAAFTGEFRTNTDLNRALSNLFKAVAQNRIPTRHAAVLAYIGQLLQKSIPDAQHELYKVDGNDGLKDLLRDALDAHDGRTEEADEETDDIDDVVDDSVDEETDDNESRTDAANESDARPSPAYRFYPNHAGGVRVPVVPDTPATEEKA